MREVGDRLKRQIIKNKVRKGADGRWEEGARCGFDCLMAALAGGG